MSTFQNGVLFIIFFFAGYIRQCASMETRVTDSCVYLCISLSSISSYLANRYHYFSMYLSVMRMNISGIHSSEFIYLIYAVMDN